jgi:hypothetical protein
VPTAPTVFYARILLLMEAQLDGRRIEQDRAA